MLVFPLTALGLGLAVFLDHGLKLVLNQAFAFAFVPHCTYVNGITVTVD